MRLLEIIRALIFAGRAEALLIAAYGKGHKLKQDESCTPDMVDELDLEQQRQRINETDSSAQGQCKSLNKLGKLHSLF